MKCEMDYQNYLTMIGVMLRDMYHLVTLVVSPCTFYFVSPIPIASTVYDSWWCA